MPTLALRVHIRRSERPKLLTGEACAAQFAHVFSIAITERGGHQRQLDVDGSEIRIGRLDDNEIVLPRGNVSKRHARVTLEDGRYVLRDLGSTNGTYVNGRRISIPTVIATGDKLYIGDFILALRDEPDSEEREFDLESAELLYEEAALEHAEAAGRSAELGATLNSPRGPTAHHASPTPAPASTRRSPLLTTTAAAVPPKYAPGRTLAPPPVAPFGTHAATHAPAAPTHAPAARSFTSPAGAAPSVGPAVTASRSGHSGPDDESIARAPTAAISPAVATTPAAATSAATAPLERQESSPASQRSARKDAPISGEWPASNRPSAATIRQPESEDAGSATTPAVLAPSLRLQGALQTLMERLGAHMDLSDPTERAFSGENQLILERLLDELARESMIAPDVDRRFLVQAAISEAVGLGPLDRLLNNRAVREVIVDGPVTILADMGGGLAAVSSFFSSPQAFHTALQRLLGRAGRELGDVPVLELWLPDGSLIQVVQPPLSARGPLLSIRRAPKPAVTLDQLVTEGMLSIDMLELLKRAILLRLNVLVVGAPGSGVSTLLSVLASMADEDERIVTWEEVPSLAIRHPHVLPLHAGQAGVRGLPELLRCVARMHADRLIIDDLAAGDVPALLPSLASQRGVFAGMHTHATSNLDAVRQLERFAFGHACPVESALVGAAFQLRLHIDGQGSGVRRVLGLTELRTADNGELDLARLYRYDGGFLHTGRRASFVAHAPELSIDGSDAVRGVNDAKEPSAAATQGSDATDARDASEGKRAPAPKGFLSG
jgi:pilus assembly protein CpaF